MWRFLKNSEIELPYDPIIPLLGIYTEEARNERDTCTPIFIAALFTIARTWRQPRCPLADEWTSTEMTQRDGRAREEGGGFRMGNTCISVVDSC